MPWNTPHIRILLLALLTATGSWCRAQLDSNTLLGLPTATSVEMIGFPSPATGTILFNTDDNYLYVRLPGAWQSIVGTDSQDLSLSGNTLSLTGDASGVDLSPYFDNTDEQDLELSGNTLSLTGDATPVDLTSFLDNTDDQNASEVNLSSAVDSDGDGSDESTVEESIQAMAPIVSKAARVFYPPSITIDASSTGTGFTKNLYSEYTNQYTSPQVSSPGAPTAIPTYASTDLYYYVTFYDTSIFDNVSVNANGLMTYDIIAVPSTYNTLINVVFVVK